MTKTATFTNAHGKVFPVVPATELNLDCEIDTEYLGSFWAHYQRGRNTKELFPNGGKGTRNATADLANYAINKSEAMACRMRGDITAATVYEDICDRIYGELPDWARGW